MTLPVLIQDSREPDAAVEPRAAFRPFIYRSKNPDEVYLNLVRKKLDSGDYSLPGLESVVALERKTLPDLIGTLFGSRTNSVGEGVANRERFLAELERLRSYQVKAIVVEADRAQVEMAVYRSRVSPKAVLASLDAIFIDYGVPTYWAGNRRGAEHFVGSTLTRIEEQRAGGEAAKKARARGVAPFLPWIAKEEDAA